MNGLTEKNVITILRQCVRVYGYKIVSKEKYMKGEKYILYQLEMDMNVSNSDTPTEEKESKIKKSETNNKSLINF